MRQTSEMATFWGERQLTWAHTYQAQMRHLAAESRLARQAQDRRPAGPVRRFMARPRSPLTIARRLLLRLA